MRQDSFFAGWPDRVRQDTDEFRLIVLSLDHAFRDYVARGSTGISSLSTDIVVKQGVPVHDQALTIRGTTRTVHPYLLDKSLTLSNFDIDKHTIFTLSCKSDEPAIIEVVVSLCWNRSRSKCLYLEPNETLTSIVLRIQVDQGVSASEICISYTSKQVYADAHAVDGVAALEVTLQLARREWHNPQV